MPKSGDNYHGFLAVGDDPELLAAFKAWEAGDHQALDVINIYVRRALESPNGKIALAQMSEPVP